MQIVMPCLSLPKYVESLLTANYAVVLDWFSGQVYANLLKRDPQHLLVQLSKQINWVKLEDLCRGFHHDQGAGAPPTHSSAQLVRALLVGYLYNSLAAAPIGTADSLQLDREVVRGLLGLCGWAGSLHAGTFRGMGG